MAGTGKATITEGREQSAASECAEEHILIEGHTVKLLPAADEESLVGETGIQHVFVIGSKGIPARYGGFETFVENLTQHRHSDRIRYHVARMAEDNLRFEYNGAVCFDIKVPYIGPARAVVCDLAALERSIRYCHRHPEVKKPVFYILACRIGPFIAKYRRQIHALGGVLYVNPDGHEWKRAKWSAPVRRYWKYSEGLMVGNADLLVCDSKNIERYIRSTYRKYAPVTEYIAYGSKISAPSEAAGGAVAEAEKEAAPVNTAFDDWLAEHGLLRKEYYLVVGRFVPENNFETMIREFMRSDTKKNFAIITTTNGRFYKKLQERLDFEKDPRIRFVGTVYDQELLAVIRNNAYANFHGHEVGGTNPSLLEALGATDLNLLLNVGFNREVAEDAALYWTKENGNLARLIGKADAMTEAEIAELGNRAKDRIRRFYNWDQVTAQYEALFLGGK